MIVNLVVAGVGGQGILSAAGLIAEAALRAGLSVKQSEVHGMAQRGGSVVAHIRISDTTIASSVVPLGTANVIIGTELLETLRAMPLAAPSCRVFSATTRVDNISDYPASERIEAALGEMEHVVLIDSVTAARAAGSARAANTVLLGAAVRYLPLDPANLESEIRRRFSAKGEAVVEANLKGFEAGQQWEA